MEKLILLTCLLIIVHIFIPILIGMISSREMSLDYLFSSRDNEIKNSNFYIRSKKSFKNLLETLPIYVMIILLSMYNNVDNFELGLYWVILRFIYIPSYIIGLKYIRTFIWASSLIVLILMGIKFL